MREIKIWHCISRENLGKIDEFGYLRSGSYVTADPIKNLTPSERAKFLCLDEYAKGECACECKTPLHDVEVPSEGSQTCKGYSQYQLKRNLPITNCSCRCEGESGGNTGAGVIVVLGVLGSSLILLQDEVDDSGEMTDEGLESLAKIRDEVIWAYDMFAKK